MSAAVQVARRFWALMAGNDFVAVAEVLADDFVLEWPQSKERIRGAERFARMNAEYPANGPWRFQVRQLFGDQEHAVSVVDVTDGVQSAQPISFFSVRDGRVSKLVEYWPEPFAAPASRAHLVEPIE